jgi:hypothetical protein
LQVRKLFCDVYLIIQRPNQLVNDLRQHINYWITWKPMWGKKWLSKYMWIYWLQELDKETFKVINEVHQAVDNNGDYYNYEVPQETKFKKIWWKPAIWKYYDDLYLNTDIEIQQRSKFLYNSWFFSNLKNWNINNVPLTYNSKVYADYTKTIKLGLKPTKPNKVSFNDNPAFYTHLFFTYLRDFYYYKYNIKSICQHYFKLLFAFKG